MSRVIIEILEEFLDLEKLLKNIANSKNENPLPLLTWMVSITSIKKEFESGDINISSEGLLDIFNSSEEKDRKFVNDLLVDISAITLFLNTKNQKTDELI